ncbi:MAG: InlB B-repeat-containing protein, partial [Oscillospiraceae bacterium]|nr:InlB B-repeat-containing protein [Oscillospiraceae bacterium]
MGWKLEGDDSGKIYTESEALEYTVVSDVVFRAVWERPKCTVTFDSDGGTDVASQEVPKGDTAEKPTDPTKENCTFDGWTLNGDAYDFSLPVTEDITLVAKWNYTVSFDANGGSGTMDSVTVGGGSEYTLPENGFTAPDEKEFEAWEINGTKYVPGNTITVTGNTTVKALWKEPWAEGSIGIEFGWVSPDSYRTAMLNPRGAFMGWSSLPYWANGAAELLDSEGNSLGSFTGESSHKFTGLKAGKYILRVTPLKPDSVYNAVESITGVSVITDYETEIEIAEGAAGTIWKYVVVEYKAYAFKTTTEIGTFASGGQAHVYYPGGNWAYENTDPASVSRCATFNTHDGIYYKDTASQYNLSVLEIPTLNEEEAAKGYTFVGWKLVENGVSSEKVYSDVEALSYVVRGDTEFKAVWEYPTHTVT